MTEENVAFVDLPQSYFPFTIEYLDPDTDEVKYTATVDGPGAMDVPSSKSLGLREVKVRVTYADGHVATA